LAYFRAFAPFAGRAGGIFPNAPDDKTVHESHFCHAANSGTRRTKLLSAEMFRTTNEWLLSWSAPTKSGEVPLSHWLDKMWQRSVWLAFTVVKDVRAVWRRSDIGPKAWTNPASAVTVAGAKESLSLQS